MTVPGTQNKIKHGPVLKKYNSRASVSKLQPDGLCFFLFVCHPQETCGCRHSVASSLGQALAPPACSRFSPFSLCILVYHPDCKLAKVLSHHELPFPLLPNSNPNYPPFPQPHWGPGSLSFLIHKIKGLINSLFWTKELFIPLFVISQRRLRHMRHHWKH